MEKYISLAQVEQLIDEMIEKIKWTPIAEYMGNPAYHTLPAQQEILEDFKSKLSSLPTEESGWIRSQEIVKDMINYEVTQREGYTDEREKRNATTCIQILTTAFDRIHKESKPLPKPPLQ